MKIKDVTSDWKRMVLGCPQGLSFRPLVPKWHVIPYKLCQSKYVHRRPSDVCHGEEAQCSRTKYQDPRWPSSILVQEQLSLSQPRKVSATLTYNNPRNVDTDSDNQNVSVDGHAIERMEEIKLLGVQIDKKKIFPVKK